MGVGYGPSVVTDKLAMCLDAGNPRSYPGSGTVWNDISGTGLNVTLVNGVTFSPANIGGLVFDGVNDQASSVSIPNPLGQLTCEVVMNYAAKSAYHNIFDRGSSSPMFWIRPSSQSSTIELNASALVSDLGYAGRIIMATAVFRSDSTPGIQLYVNGNLAKTTTAAQSAWPDPFTITLFNRGGTSTFQGTIYSLRFYSKALTSAEVAQNFAALRGRYGI